MVSLEQRVATRAQLQNGGLSTPFHSLMPNKEAGGCYPIEINSHVS